MIDIQQWMPPRKRREGSRRIAVGFAVSIQRPLHDVDITESPEFDVLRQFTLAKTYFFCSSRSNHDQKQSGFMLA